MSQDEKQLAPLLTASVRDVRYLASLLRGVHFSNVATIGLAKSGLTVTVEEARTIHAKAFIFAPLFDEYEMHIEDDDGGDDNTTYTTFQIHLNILIDCLNIFGTAGPASAGISVNSTSNLKRWRREEDGSDQEGEGAGESRTGGGRGLAAYFGNSEKSTSMRMSYVGDGYPLTLLIAEDASGPTTTCEISTYAPEPHLNLDIDFDSKDIAMRVILKSSWLRDALSELDPSTEKLTIIGNPIEQVAGGGRPRQRLHPAPLFRIQAEGAFGSTEMDYPNDREVIETFESNRSVSCSYRFSHLFRTLRALSSSTKTSVRINEDGLLSLQFLMPKPGSTFEGFIEFRCLPLDE